MHDAAVRQLTGAKDISTAAASPSHVQDTCKQETNRQISCHSLFPNKDMLGICWASDCRT
jgi:hypothetical protein